MNDPQIRFKDSPVLSVDPTDVVIIGAGGIGAPVILELSKLNHNLYVYDNQLVAQENQLTQGYAANTVGTYKVDAIYDRCRAILGAQPRITKLRQQWVSGESLVSKYMIVAVDNMATRKAVFDTWKELPDRQMLIEARMVSDYFILYCVTPETEEQYAATLYDDESAFDAECTNKWVPFVGIILAGLICNNFINYLINQKYGFVTRNVDYECRFNGSIGFLKTDVG